MPNTAQRSEPIRAADARGLAHRWGEFCKAVMVHLAAGSPTHGLSNSFMARSYLWSLYDHIGKILQSELTGSRPLPMKETVEILEDWYTFDRETRDGTEA